MHHGLHEKAERAAAMAMRDVGSRDLAPFLSKSLSATGTSPSWAQEQEEQRSDGLWSGHGGRATTHVTRSSSCPSVNFGLSLFLGSWWYLSQHG